MLKKTLFNLIVISLFSLNLFGEESLNSSNDKEKSKIEKKIHKPPVLTTAAIIEIYEKGNFLGIVLIDRGNAPFGKALPGGKVEIGETVEEAIRREMLEEVNLELVDLKQFHVYSDPKRDFRHHSIEVTYLAKAFKKPQAGDDAAKAYIYKLDELPFSKMAFDHSLILQDYLNYRKGSFSDCILNEKEQKSFEIVKKENRVFHANSKTCLAFEYPTKDLDINVALVEVNGRYPEKGFLTAR